MGRFLLVFIFRTLLLAVGGGLAALVGVAIATTYPDPTPSKPLAAQLLPGIDDGNADLKPETGIPMTTPPTATTPSPQLSPAQREKLEAELKQLKARNKAGNPTTAAADRKRVQEIESQLQGTAPPPVEVDRFTATSTSFFSPDRRMAVLPGDALFEDNKSVLRPEAGVILDKIAEELSNYPRSTIRIAAHTDDAGEAKANRQLSFRQAEALEQYLSSQLGDRYRWLAIGYGETRPLTGVPNDTDINRQRNRRIEIAID